MDNNYLELVTSEQAKKLKAVGFDWPVDYRYDTKGGLCLRAHQPWNFNDRRVATQSEISAPTVALALKWMRDVKGLQCGVDPAPWGERAEDDTPRYCGHWIERVSELDAYTSYSDTYEAAESALLDELLTLIKETKHNPHNTL